MIALLPLLWRSFSTSEGPAQCCECYCNSCFCWCDEWCFAALWPGDGAIGKAWRTFRLYNVTAELIHARVVFEGFDCLVLNGETDY